MSNRRRLPNRRGSITFDLQALGLTFTVAASRFNDGSLGEVFIQNHKTNSAAGILASDCAIAASLALQFGCPVEVLARALSRNSQNVATGPLGAALDLLTAQR
jgi:ribonucleoside-diphosphate reductase alpha chain